MKIIYSLSLFGFIATSTNAAALNQDQAGFVPSSDQVLTGSDIRIFDIFLETYCGDKVKSARTVWNALTDSQKRTVLNIATDFSVPGDVNYEPICKLLQFIEVRSEQLKIASDIEQLLSPEQQTYIAREREPFQWKPQLEEVSSHPSIEQLISKKCDGVQMPFIIRELKLEISRFAVSRPDNSQIALFCGLLGGSPKAGG